MALTEILADGGTGETIIVTDCYKASNQSRVAEALSIMRSWRTSKSG